MPFPNSLASSLLSFVVVKGRTSKIGVCIYDRLDHTARWARCRSRERTWGTRVQHWNPTGAKVLFSLNASGAKIRFWIGDSTCDQRGETGLYGRSLIVLCTAVLFGFGQSPTILIVKRQRSEMTILFRTESNYSNSEKTKVWNDPFSSTRNIS